jgi:hypothetical protein
MSKFNNLNLFSPAPTPWIASLKKDQSSDPYALFKDSISLMLETDALKIQNHLMAKHPEYTKEVALKVAVCLLMERMLALQNEHSPTSLDSMIMSLFIELPTLREFRTEIIQQAQYEAQRKQKPKGFFARLFGL